MGDGKLSVAIPSTTQILGQPMPFENIIGRYKGIKWSSNDNAQGLTLGFQTKGLKRSSDKKKVVKNFWLFYIIYWSLFLKNLEAHGKI